MILRDTTEADLDVLFDIQDDDIARHVAGFTSPDGADRDSYVARQRGFLADGTITKKVILGSRCVGAARRARRPTSGRSGLPDQRLAPPRSPPGRTVTRTRVLWGAIVSGGGSWEMTGPMTGRGSPSLRSSRTAKSASVSFSHASPNGSPRTSGTRLLRARRAGRVLGSSRDDSWARSGG